MLKLNALIAGSTGYIGVQLIKLLVKHKNVKIKYLCGNSSIGKKISFYDKTIKKKLPRISKLDKSKMNECDIIFTALPNGDAQKISKLLNKKNILIDLSADFRIKKVNIYKKFYKIKHKSKKLLNDSVYGLSELNEKRLDVCSKNLSSKCTRPDDQIIADSSFDVVFDTVGLEITRQSAIKYTKPGGLIIHIGLSQPSGVFDFRKATLQEITFIGTYCYTNKDFENTLKLLSNNEIGDLNWIEYRELSKGAEAFKQIHDGSCSAPKIILLP